MPPAASKHHGDKQQVKWKKRLLNCKKIHDDAIAALSDAGFGGIYVVYERR